MAMDAGYPAPEVELDYGDFSQDVTVTVRARTPEEAQKLVVVAVERANELLSPLFGRRDRPFFELTHDRLPGPS